MLHDGCKHCNTHTRFHHPPFRTPFYAKNGIVELVNVAEKAPRGSIGSCSLSAVVLFVRANLCAVSKAILVAGLQPERQKAIVGIAFIWSFQFNFACLTSGGKRTFLTVYPKEKKLYSRHAM